MTDNPHCANTANSKHSKKRQKRARGHKFRIINVVQTGEQPIDKRLKGGRVRKLDVLRSKKKLKPNNNKDLDGNGNRTRLAIEDENDVDNVVIPRKTREMLQRMAKHNDNNPKIQHQKQKSNQNNNSNNDLNNISNLTIVQPKGSNPPITTTTTAASISSPKLENSNNNNKPQFTSMQPGESYTQFTNRLRRERRQMSIDMGKQMSHQREKKRAHYAKREMGKKQKKQSKSNLEQIEDDDEVEGMASLPLYWQEIVKNNGRPVSQKKRKKMDRLEKERELIQFGEQAEQPPTLTSIPKKRGSTAPITSS